ncbi:TetR/AcrR family transcriptional regulator [Ktedonosporobacter rubrisoli]|uniref:TetR/AcrR family transcriptional regulator n=1 Tax=Ktedonosporobacter rubrisoli TaxID=2509675 RepID=A0A4P6JHJ7_KTERU|nr:TetR/AcrR family transcriptional regulator [Ktedonosporobacter rubrisoli]QBD74488.1 TetR/AcrR family transcriptional regulator [Ktedonosporobacter rubrisoli]
MELMREKRFAAITVQDIADRAEVNRGTFYTHFADKYELLEAIMHEQLSHILASKLPQAVSWGKEHLRVLIQTILEVFAEAYGRCPPTEMTDPLMRKATQEQLTRLLLGWFKKIPVARGERNVPVEIRASMISWAILGVVVEWSQGEKMLSIQEMTNHILSVITEGAAPLALDRWSE